MVFFLCINLSASIYVSAYQTFFSCRIRKSTYDRLSKIPMEEPNSEHLSFQLRQSLLSDPISPVLTEAHLQALDRRLKIAMKNIEKCIDKHGKTTVVIDDGL